MHLVHVELVEEVLHGFAVRIDVLVEQRLQRASFLLADLAVELGVQIRAGDLRVQRAGLRAESAAGLLVMRPAILTVHDVGLTGQLAVRTTSRITEHLVELTVQIAFSQIQINWPERFEAECTARLTGGLTGALTAQACQTVRRTVAGY